MSFITILHTNLSLWLRRHIEKLYEAEIASTLYLVNFAYCTALAAIFDQSASRLSLRVSADGGEA